VHLVAEAKVVKRGSGLAHFRARRDGAPCGKGVKTAQIFQLASMEKRSWERLDNEFFGFVG
jgi:hypothetical protein